MRVEVNRLHRDEQRRAQRRRDGVLALAALLFHAALLAAIPGFAIPPVHHQPLLIELAQPAAEQIVAQPPTPETVSKAPGGGVELPGPTRANQPLNRQTMGNPAAGPRRQNVRPAARSPRQDTGKGHSAGEAKGNVKQTPQGESSPPKNMTTDSTEVGRGQAITSKGQNEDKAISDEVKPAPSKSAGVGLKPGAKAQANAGPGKARPGNGKGTGDSAGDGLDSKPSPNKGSAAGPPVKAQPQDGGQGGASARPGKEGGNGPGGGPGKGEGPGGNGSNEAVVKPPAPPNNDAALMAAWVADAKKKVRMLARTPEIAKEKGHTGKVSFSFVVNKRGRLVSVSINGSPGFSELDEECREATRVASFKPFPAGVQAQQWTVSMALNFPIS